MARAPRKPMLVELGDGREFEVTPDMRDMRNWEKEHRGAPFQIDPIPLERLTYIAWSAARREGKFDGPWMAFDSLVMGINEPGDDEPSTAELEQLLDGGQVDGQQQDPSWSGIQTPGGT